MTSIVAARYALIAMTFTLVAAVTGWFAHRPSYRASRLGLRGLKRRSALAERTVWNALEPLVRWLGVQVSRFVSDRLRRDLDGRLTRAGDPLGLTPDEYAAIVVLLGLLGLASGMTLLAKMPSLGLAALTLGIFCGAATPSLVLAAATRDRQLKIRRGLPYVVDVLCLSLGAGCDFTGAVAQVAGKMRGNDAIREELLYFLQQLQVGQSRTSALRELAERVPIAPVRELTMAIEQAEERGNSIMTTLEIQAAASRIVRSNDAHRAAENAVAKMVVPTMGLSAVGLYFVATAMAFFEKSILSP